MADTPRPHQDQLSKRQKTSHAPSHWLRQFGRDVTVLYWFKAAGTAVFMCLFFQAYFYLLRHPAYPVVVIPATAADHAIAFSAPWVLVYFSLWIYVSLPGAVQCNRVNLFWHALGFFTLCLAGVLFYYFFPTTLEPAAVDWSGMPVGKILQTVDQAGNAFPSMHVATALFACLWLHRELRRVHAPKWVAAANALWCLSIVYSTLATKQHVVLDVLAGLLLGSLTGVAFTWAADYCSRQADALPKSGKPLAHKR